MKTPHDMTLYNKSISSGDEVYTRHEIRGVMWENNKAANVIKSGLLEANSVTVYVLFSRGSFAFKSGDILVKGIVTDVINSSFTISSLKAKYADVVKITSVDTKDMGSAGMQHWQIGAK